MRTTMLLIFTIILAAMTIFSQTMPPIEAGVSQSLAKWRAANYSDVRYKLNLTLEKMSPTLKGTIEISLKNNADRIVLDWRKIRGKEGLSTVSNVSINGKAAVSSSDFSRLSSGNAKPTEVKTQNFYEFNEHLVFKDGVIKGENVIRLDFTSPIATSGAAITRYVDKEDGAEYVYSLFVPSDASTAFPVFDQPDLKAKFKLTVTAPKDWKVVTNTDFYNHFDLEGVSRFVSVQGDSATSAFWEAAPISTYVFAFAAGNFEVFSESEFLKTKQLTTFSSPRRKMHHDKAKDVWTEDEEGIEIYVRKSQAEKFKQHAAEVFRLNREGVKFLESYFDYKFPFPKYDLVLIPEFPFGGMEHAGATFLREDRVIFPTEPTKNDYITRANVILHEAAHQWFGDTVTMKWFDDLWLKEGFAEFMAYKTLAQVMPEYNAWKIFYERNKQLAYLTDATKGTAPIYQEIPNLSAAKSAYGNIVYRKAPSFLRQAEFYLGEDKFQAAVRAFLKKHEFANAEWTDLVKEFEAVSGGRQKEDFTTLTKVSEKRDLSNWAKSWVTRRGMPIVKFSEIREYEEGEYPIDGIKSLRLEVKRDWYKLQGYEIKQKNILNEGGSWLMSSKILIIDESGKRRIGFVKFTGDNEVDGVYSEGIGTLAKWQFAFPNYQDYGYGIFLLDERSRAYVLENIQTEKDDFLRAMMWGSLWDSVRESELNPKDYVELVIKNINVESDESTIQTLLNRVSVAMIYYLSELPTSVRETLATDGARETGKPRTDVGGSDLCERLETLLIDKMQNAPTLGMRITFYRAFLNIASSEKARIILKQIYMGDFGFGGGDTKTRAGVKKVDGKMIYAANPAIPIKTKDRLDIVTKLLILGDAAAPKMLAELEKTETSDEAKRYAYAAKAGIGTTENKAGFWNDFTNNKEISESYLESSLGAFNSPKQADLTLPYLEKALRELPNLKRSRKIFFVNGWLAAFIGGQKSEQALAIVSKFLADNPNLDKDLRLKILENADGLERAVKIRAKFSEH